MATIPRFHELMNPLLQALRNLDGEATLDEMEAEVARIMDLSQEQTTMLHNPERGDQTRLGYRLAWARTYLKKVGLLENPERGVWALSEQGEQVEEVNTQEVRAAVRSMSERLRDEDQEPQATRPTPETTLAAETSEPRSLSPHLQDYEDARVFLRVLDGVPYNHLRRLINNIKAASGTPQDPTDWSNPNQWIPRRLEGPAQDLARRLWEESDRQMYLRSVQHIWLFLQTHELADRDDADRITVTARGRRFIEGDKSVILSIDRYEGMLVVLAALEKEGPARMQDLIPAFAFFCRARTRLASDSAFRSYLRNRLNNLVSRGLVAHSRPLFRLTEEGRSYLERHRGLVEPFESPAVEEEPETDAGDAAAATQTAETAEPPSEKERETVAQTEAATEPPSVAELFHRVEGLLSPGEEVVTVPPEMSVDEALRLMRRNRLSHLPVTAGRSVLGVFSHRSFSDRLMGLGKTSQFVGDWPVDEFMEQLRYHHRSDSWQTILEALREQRAVLVGNPEGLEGLVTPMDAVDYLQKISSPFVMLAEIEQSLRRIIRARLDEHELPELVERSLSSAYPEGQAPHDLSEMTFNDYAMLVTTRDNWEYFSEVFGRTEWARKRTNSKLIQIRKLRNDIFHFRREVTESDRKRLAEFRNWLESKARAYEGRQRE